MSKDASYENIVEGRDNMDKMFLLNIQTRKIHNGLAPCQVVKLMSTEHTKVFYSLDEAVNFFEGDKKGELCTMCKRKWMKEEK